MNVSNTPPVAWITGASSGIGEALAIEMARRGYHLVLSARRADRLDTLNEKIIALGARAAVCPVDVTDTEAVLAVPQAAAHELGCPGIDVAVANAGVLHYGRVADLALEDEHTTFDVNVKGVLNTVRAVLPDMLARDSGHIVAVSSIAGLAPLPERAAYTASKAAVHFYMDSLRLELHDTGVTVGVILPGYVESQMTAPVRSSMPFFWTAERAAKYIVDRIERKRGRIAFPWPLHFVIALSRFLPRPLREWGLRRQRVVRDEKTPSSRGSAT